jgi:secernin
VCDSLCLLGDGVTLFAKNSDRPRTEPQVVEVFADRPPGSGLRTQYLEISDTGALSTILSRPTWLWGAEHGINEHRVAIGNEMIFTAEDPRRAAPALIGMDLVRLGLERGSTAEDALDTMTALLETHGQGGIGDPDHGLSYWSSFLIADPTSAWILETSRTTWAARPVASGAAISNRLTLRRDWTRASADVPPGTDVATWRHPRLSTGFADVRLAASRTVVDTACASLSPSPVCDPRAVVGALRDHGTGPWGSPGGSTVSSDTVSSDTVSSDMVSAAPAPDTVSPDGDGWTICLHAGDTSVTTASMVALLPADRHDPARAWTALGSPCVSVYVPVPVPDASSGYRIPPPAAVRDPSVWARFAAVRDAVGSDAGALQTVRSELSPVEDALWDEADDLGVDPARWESFGVRATVAVGLALDKLVTVGLGGSEGPERPERL